MNHIKSNFYFEDKNNKWLVEYTYISTKYDERLIAKVYVNDTELHQFNSFNTRTVNPTKTQAKELITKVKKDLKLKSVII